MAGGARTQTLEWYSNVPRTIRPHTVVGLLLIAVFFSGFGAWATLAPLAAAVIANGTFVATGSNKVVQHLEGGIIKQILVNEGDNVVAGQPLIRLDETAAQAKVRQLFLRHVRLEAEVARLKTEAAGTDHIAFPAIVTENAHDAAVEAMMDEQQNNFASARQKNNTDISLLKSNIASLKYRIEGYRKLKTSLGQQISLFRDERRSKEVLFKKGLIRASEMRAIDRAIAQATGNLGRTDGEIAETAAQVEKYGQQIAQTKDAFREAALDRLQAAGAELDSVREESREAQSILKRITIDAPVSGIVVHMDYHTPGGVIEGGKSILEILPSNVPLIIETQVRRTDIDSVKIGQNATVRLIALNRRRTPVLNGKVFYVSADALPIEKGYPQEVYVVRISISASEFARIPGFSPTPGMPAQVLIETAHRTFLSYLVKPIEDSMSRAFTER